MNQQSMRFRIGVFVLATLVLLGVLITLFGTFPALFRRTNEFTITFSDAPGVDTGTPVRRSGVRIGEVKDLTLDNETGKVHVRVAIDKKYTIRHNEQPTLVHGLLGGDTSIDFVPRRPEPQPPDQTPIQAGEDLEGIEQANVASLLNQAAEVVPTTQEALSQMSKSLKRLEQMAPLTESTLKEYNQLAKDTQGLVRDLRETNKEVQGLAKDMRTVMPELNRTNTAVQELVKATRDTIPELRKTNDEIQITARNWGKLGERLDVLLQTNQDKLVKTIDNLNDTLTRISSVFNDANQRNLAETLKNVRAGTQNLESITRNTDELLRESQKTIKRVNDSVARADDVLGNLQQATRPMAERSASIMKNLDEVTGKLNKTLTDAHELLRGFGESDGTLRRLLTDPALYNHLDEAACMVTHILPRLDRAMKDIEVFADKLARHPEAIGLGGVVRPGTGVKDYSTGAAAPFKAP